MNSVLERFTQRRRMFAAGLGIALVSLAAGYGLHMLGGESSGAGSPTDTDCEDVLYWYDPMVPGQRFDEPGKSPFMDMMLVPKCAGEAAEAGVRIDPGLVQNFGIRTAAAEFGVLEPEITVTGVLAYNSRDIAIVQPRAGATSNAPMALRRTMSSVAALRSSIFWSLIGAARSASTLLCSILAIGRWQMRCGSACDCLE